MERLENMKIQLTDKEISNLGSRILDLKAPLESLYNWADVISYSDSIDSDKSLVLFNALTFLSVAHEQLQNTVSAIDRLVLPLLECTNKEVIESKRKKGLEI